MQLSRRFLVSLVGAVLLASVAKGQQNAPAKLTIGILPLDDGTGQGLSAANAAALAKQLRAEFLKSERLAPRLLNLPDGTALPLEPEKAAEVGRAAKTDLVLAATLLRAETKQSDKGMRGPGSIFGTSVGGRVQSVSAEVKLQVELIRVGDGQRLATFTVEGKKTDAHLSADINSNLGSTDFGSPGFTGSPLGQALQQAMQKLATQVEMKCKAMPAPASTAPSDES